MLAPWLLYASAIGALLVVAARLLEVVARWQRIATRWIWLASIVGTIALPLSLNVALRRTIVVRAVPAESPSLSPAAGRVASAAPVTPPIDLDRPLAAFWLAASLLVAARVAGGAVMLRRRRSTWQPAEIDGVPVLVANDLGPAVVGWTRLTTVLPEWALSLDEPSRAMMLAHEAEHSRSGDPYLRAVALAALVLMPWNLALWYAARRMRLAVEIDCDQRLLRRGTDPRAYSAFLLTVGERIAATPFAWVTALAGPRTSLESRIVAMLSPFRPRHPRLLGAAIASAIVALAVIACRAPVPESVLPPSASKSPAAVPPESATPKVEAATLIKTDTFTTTCARTPNNRCRISGTIVAVTKHSDMLSLATLQRLSGLDQVRVDTVFKQCGPQYVCQAAKERLDTFIVLHPKSSEPGGIIRLDQKLHAEDFEEPSRPVGHAQRAEVGTDSLACKAKAPRVLAEWLGAKKVALWTRCGGGVKADSAGGA